MASLALIPLPAAAESWHCAMTAPDGRAMAIDFAFDPAAFAPPLSPNDPPRRVVAQARVGTDVFDATPFRMPDGTLGFEAERDRPGLRLLVVAPDGAARYSNAETGESLPGHCERTD